MQLHSLLKRVWYQYPYVIPALVLSDRPVDGQDTSSLREDASRNGVCYLHIIRSLNDGTFLVRVAAQPDQLRTHGFTLVLNAAQIALAHPYDCRVKRVA